MAQQTGYTINPLRLFPDTNVFFRSFGAVEYPNCIGA